MNRRAPLLAASLSCLVVACSDYSPRAEEPVYSSPADAPAAPEPARGSDGGGGGGAPDAAAATTAEAPADAQRKVFYDGYVKVEAPDPAAAVEAVASRVRAAGGYVETQTQTSVVARVPVDRFQQAYDDALKLGKVLDKTLSAQDITEAYADVELRKKLVEATLAKLEQILARTDATAERLALLKEIGALKERLEQIAAVLKSLGHMAQYSRLSLDAVAPAREVARGQTLPLDAFRWIQQLAPDRDLVMRQGRRAELAVPEGFVAVSGKPYFFAESASKTTLRAVRLRNAPRGDARFWADAIRQRLGERFKPAGVETSGAFTVVRFDDDDGAFRYDVAIAPEGDELLVAEAFYPSQADASRYAGKVLAALAAAGGKAQ